MMFLW